MSAYACEPLSGSEPGVGWAWAKAAAIAGHEVLLFTRENNRSAIELALAENDLTIHPIYFDLSPGWLRAKSAPFAMRIYYVAWQKAARAVIRGLHRDPGFDLAHHVTFAADWLPAATSAIEGVPNIWGPIGGTTQPPNVLRRFLGVRGNLAAAVRGFAGHLGRSVWGNRSAKAASLTIALNEDVAGRFGSFGDSIVEPNCALDRDLIESIRSSVSNRRASKWRRAIFVGRLEAWKGLAIAIRAIADEAASNWILDVYGTGPDESRVRALATSRDVGDRIRFRGARPRRETLLAMARADALVHPAVHDSSPWAVAEAVSLGTPVVCMSVGGPRLIASKGHAEVIRPSLYAPYEIASALRRIENSDRPQPTDAWLDSRLPDLLTRWYEAAINRVGGSGGDD